ncbi:hypothetical protein SeLEV6574_g07598 [Synchytrium endobioticum]|uniref:Chromo domain-containing protein n=1 Tax=Synchytrium endobioticum TaxID=286115 RepID=A0A507CCP3_9FUNG|nr:hypothetical protein SeLEV6574_g07598 [Synchytrium endobioticum]
MDYQLSVNDCYCLSSFFLNQVGLHQGYIIRIHGLVLHMVLDQVVNHNHNQYQLGQRLLSLNFSNHLKTKSINGLLNASRRCNKIRDELVNHKSSPGSQGCDSWSFYQSSSKAFSRSELLPAGVPMELDSLKAEINALQTKLNLASRASSSSSRNKGKGRVTGNYGKLSVEELQRRKDFALCLVDNPQPQDHKPGVSIIKEKQKNIKSISISTPSTSTSSSQSAYLTGVKVLSSTSRKLIYIPITLFIPEEVSTVAMIDSGASTSFIFKAFVDRHGIPTQPLNQNQTVSLASGDGTIKLTHETTDLTVCLEEHTEAINFAVINSLNSDIVLGMNWLEAHDCQIQWSSKVIIFKSQYCFDNCGITRPKIIYGHESVKSLRCLNSIAHVKNPGTKELPSSLKAFSDVFQSKDVKSALPPHREGLDCSLQLRPGANLPTVQPIYRLSKLESQELRKYLDDMLAQGLIQASNSPIASPIFFVPKPGGDGLRPCVDYRDLNEVLVKDKYPLPLIDNLVDLLHGATVFSKIDLRLILGRIPDLLVFSKKMADHHLHLRSVLQRLRDNHLTAKLEKCEFFRPSVEFCGFLVSKDGIKMSPTKVQAVQKWQPPTDLKSLQSFLGFLNFYRKFIKDFSKIALPLTRLTRDDQPYVWSDECQRSFSLLKSLVTESPVLRIPDPNQPFVIDTDASDFALGAVLYQRDTATGKLRPCAYRSEKLSGSQLNYSINDKELLSIVKALESWRHYVLGTPDLLIRCDHKNLLYFTKKQHLSPRHVRWSMALSEFSFRIQHISGKANAGADALSRLPQHQPTAEEQELRLDRVLLSTIVVQEHELQEDIIAARHDAPAAGHFGMKKTLANIRRDFQWHGMRKMVKEYINRCHTCHLNKVPKHHPYGLLNPLPVPDYGQTERVNAVLEQYLRCFVNDQQKNWVKYLSLAEFAYNSAEHSSTKISPFYANYGFNPKMDFLANPSADALANDAAADNAHALEAILKELKLQMAKAQESYSRFANRLRQNHSFKVGDWVYLQTKGISGSKLDTRYIGPFYISKEISKVSFRLQLPNHMKIHPVFHVNLFKPAETPTLVESQHSRIVIPQNRINRVPHSVIRVNHPGSSPRRRWEWLVHWADSETSDDTWEPATFFEDYEELLTKFYRGKGSRSPKPSDLETLIYENLQPIRTHIHSRQ